MHERKRRGQLDIRCVRLGALATTKRARSEGSPGMQVRVFSPRRKPITTEVGAGETFGGIRTRLGKDLGIASERGLILHRGETVSAARACETRARLLHAPCNQSAAPARLALLFCTSRSTRVLPQTVACVRSPDVCCSQVKDDEPASSRLQGSEEVVTLPGLKPALAHCNAAVRERARPRKSRPPRRPDTLRPTGAVLHGDSGPAKAGTSQPQCLRRPGHVWHARRARWRNASGQSSGCRLGGSTHAAHAAGPAAGQAAGSRKFCAGEWRSPSSACSPAPFVPMLINAWI